MKVTVKEKTENEIDWNEPQMVISKTENSIIVQISTNQSEAMNEHNFVGQELNRGIFSVRWKKSFFKKFNGTITIEQ